MGMTSRCLVLALTLCPAGGPLVGQSPPPFAETPLTAPLTPPLGEVDSSSRTITLVPVVDSTPRRQTHWLTGAIIGSVVVSATVFSWGVGACEKDCSTIGTLGGSLLIGAAVGGTVGGLIGSLFPKHPPARPESSQ
jgi:hypothetical protein